jgi:hypothetical protein
LRRIPLSRRSHIIGFQPLATGTTEHESALERDFVTLTTFLHPDASFTSQPVTLRFSDSPRTRRYTPDFLVRYRSDHAELIEVKYRTDLRAHFAQLRPGFEAARRWAGEHGAIFRIATERGIRGPILDNAKRLLPLRDVPVDLAVAEFVLAKTRASRDATFGEVLAALPVSREVGLATLWRMIARRTLRVDFATPITFATRVSST